MAAEDRESIVNVQMAYGYYHSTKAWDDLAALFAENGTIEVAMRGVYVGRPSVRRSLDLASMAEHLASKHDWIRALPDGDHVARMLVRGLASDPNRLEEVIAEVAMGRSIVEG